MRQQREVDEVLGLAREGCPRGVWRLRIALDAVYPDIVAECVRAVEAVAPGRAGVYRRPKSRVSDVSNYWKHWPCLIPQHGPGRKHTRPIILADWQQQICVDACRALPARSDP